MSLRRVWAAAMAGLTLCMACGQLFADAAADLKTAREQLQRGQYDEAIRKYEPLADKGEPDVRPAAVGLARAYLAKGDWEKAEERLAAAADQFPDSAEVLAHLAKLHFDRGRYPEAKQKAEVALSKSGEQLLARLVRARVKAETGQLPQATEDFRWFVTLYNRRPPKDAESLLIVAEGSAEYARAKSVGQVFSFIVNDLTPDALKADATAWEADLISGSLLLEKYNNGQATQEFKRGLEINPRSADLLVGMARAEEDERNPEKAREYAEQAIAINARHLSALLVLADLELGAENPEAALPFVKRALAVNPSSQAALARLAACDLLMRGIPKSGLTAAILETPAKAGVEWTDRQFLVLYKALLERNPAPGRFLTDLGEALEQARRYEAATVCYARAIEVAPQMSAPRTALGLLQMRTGDLPSARKILDDAFKADRFHVRVSNMRKVLDVIERYETLSTDHFILRFDKSDRIFASFLAEELESMYGPLTKEFGYEPPQRTAFEVYSAASGESGHSWFSARMTGMPWIQTIGASTGMIVALASPTERESYNWARVAKHEFSHVLTLQETSFGIPHWYTEALAVRTEGDTFPETWRRSLLSRRDKGTLFTLETVNSGFQRPKNGDDWQHAYCMSRLYARYMEEKYGTGSLFKLVSAYGRGLKTPVAVKEVFGVPVDEFEKDFRTFLDRTIEELGKGKASRSPSLAEAEAALKKDSGNLDRQADVAWAILNEAPPPRGAEAGEMAAKILKQSPRHPLALGVVARIALRGRMEKAARAALDEAFDPAKPHPNIVGLLGRMAFDDKDYERAAEVFSAGLKQYPKELGWTFLLAVSLAKQGEEERLPELFAFVASQDYDDTTSREWLLGHAIKHKKWDEAIRWGREAMQVDVRDARTHRLLGQAYLEKGNRERARRHLETAIELSPDDEAAKKMLERLK